MRYVNERQVNLSDHSKQIIRHQSGNNGEIINNSSNALKHLKKFDDYVDTMKRRLSVIQIKDEKYIKKAQRNEKKILFQNIIHEQNTKRRKHKMDYLEYMNQQIERKKQEANDQRILSQSNKKQIYQKLHEKKRKNYKQSKDRSEYENEIKNEIQKIQLEQKKQQKKKILQKQKQQINLSKRYLISRTQSIRSKQVIESEQIKNRQEIKLKELKQLGKLQAVFISRQSQSRQNVIATERKLNKFISPNKSIKRKQAIKLPELSTSTTVDNLIIMKG